MPAFGARSAQVRYRVVVGPGGSPIKVQPAASITVALGADMAAAVSGAAAGTTFYVAAGVHRGQFCTPKAGQRFIGAPGAILNGSKLLGAFTKDGALARWYIDGQTQQGLDRSDLGAFCRPGFRCTRPDAVFVDNVQQQHVPTLAEVTGPGKYFLDYATDRLTIGTDPAGKVIEAAVTPGAFIHAAGATGVRIEGLTVEKYASPLQHAAIGGNANPDGWTVERCEVRLNNGVGIRSGPRCRVLGNFVHHNGSMGLGGAEAAPGSLVEGNEVAWNGELTGLDPLYEGGGAKWAVGTGLVVRGNHFHDNYGYGPWTDINNYDTLYENNRVENNRYGGIVHEISYGAVIRYNICRFNGDLHGGFLWGGQIQVQNSRDVQVYGNKIDCTAPGVNGITLIEQNRAAENGATGPYVVRNCAVHHNVVIAGTFDQGRWGLIEDTDDATRIAALKAGGNSFDSNEYRVENTANDHWAWVDQDFATVTQMRAAQISQELNSTVTAYAAPAVPANALTLGGEVLTLGGEILTLGA